MAAFTLAYEAKRDEYVRLKDAVELAKREAGTPNLQNANTLYEAFLSQNPAAAAYLENNPDLKKLTQKAVTINGQYEEAKKNLDTLKAAHPDAQANYDKAEAAVREALALQNTNNKKTDAEMVELIKKRNEADVILTNINTAEKLFNEKERNHKALKEELQKGRESAMQRRNASMGSLIPQPKNSSHHSQSISEQLEHMNGYNPEAVCGAMIAILIFDLLLAPLSASIEYTRQIKNYEEAKLDGTAFDVNNENQPLFNKDSDGNLDMSRELSKEERLYAPRDLILANKYVPEPSWNDVIKKYANKFSEEMFGANKALENSSIADQRLALRQKVSG